MKHPDLRSGRPIIKMVGAESRAMSKLKLVREIGSTPGALGISTAMIADGAVITAKILNDNVTSPKIAPGTVITGDVADGAVEDAKLHDDAVETLKIKNLNVTLGKIAALTVTVTQLADNSVEEAKILNANVTAGKLAADAVETDKILNANVTAGKLAADAVETDKILNANVTTGKLAALAVTNSKLFIKTVDVYINGGDLSASSLPDADLAGGTILGYSEAGTRFIQSITLDALGSVTVTLTTVAVIDRNYKVTVLAP